jgi:phosphonate transport system substrate-binding protein
MLKKTVKIASLVLALMLAMSMAAACSSAAPVAAPATQAPAAATQAPAAATPAPTAAPTVAPAPTVKPYSTITITWYPNESANGYAPVRDEVCKLITQATGKKVIQMMTTDYTIAVSALANGTAQICGAMGVYGYLLAQQQNPAVKPLFVNTGKSGTLDDAYYYSRFCVNNADAPQYMGADGKYSITNIAGKKISFVSTSSTSGFLFPGSAIVAFFGKQSQWSGIALTDIQMGGSGKLFSDVLFGQTHQGSAVNLLSGKADVACFDDSDLVNYTDLVSGTESQPGAVYKVKDGAQAPFDTLVGKQFTVIESMTVKNGPWGYNSGTLSADDVQKIQALFTSDTVTNDTLIFKPASDTNPNDFGIYSQTGKIHFVTFDDNWYDSIRAMIQ